VRARPLVLGCAVLAVCSLAACGAERHKVPPIKVSVDSPRKHFRYASVGLDIELPSAAPGDRRRPPGVFRSSLGESFIAGFAYRRAEQLPRNRGELEAARRRLVAQINKRDRSFRVIRSRSTRAAGARAVEVVGDQRIAGATLRTRSLHVYKGSGEYVLDMLSPVRDFAGMDRTYFAPAVRSVKVTGKVAGRRRS
jgi:hypothetical protein